MGVVIKLTQIPQLNSIVIKQEGGHFFIAAPNSIIIDRVGFLKLIKGLVDIGFISINDLPKYGNHDVDEYYKET